MKKILALFLVFSLAPLKSWTEETIQDRLRNKKLVAAHQGGVFDGTPNTLQLFEHARRNGADIIEMDLHLSKEGIPVVFHDDTLDSLTDCQGKVSDLTVAELKKCEISFVFRGGNIPTFEEVLQWNNGRIILNAEFKVPEAVVPAIRLVEKYKAYSSVYFQTKGDPQLYTSARSQNPKVALLFAPPNVESLNWALSLNDDFLVVIELHENLRTKEIIDAIHRAHKWASENSWHWRFDHEFFGVSCAEGFYEIGLDILVSNRPKQCGADRADFRISLKAKDYNPR
ncbi:MAG TPA: glycerophosphodiester phosphodiesterase family protein [Pseudobdellovibrionaceae bacterium]|jgi:glycerophosphoryl diester phosphodiesterase